MEGSRAKVSPRYRSGVTRIRLAGLLAVVAALLGGPALAAGTPVQQTWHADQIFASTARDAGRGGADVVVAVLDSWVDAAHPDFEGRVLPGADCLRALCRPGPASSDPCDHGTHVAGTIASSSFGVATRARILPVRVLVYDPKTGQCVGRPEDVTAGIRWAVSNGARIVNLSLGPDVPGLSGSTSIPQAVAEAARAGVVVVFSAGNTGLPVTDTYGGSALIVAATGPGGALASYTQRGVGVDLAAPGGDPRVRGVCTKDDCVTSLFPGGRYSVAAGTSMAAPHVSGVAALLFGQDPGRTREQVLGRLLGTARPLANAGRGLLDAQAALGAAGAPTRAQAGAPPAPVAKSAPAVPSPVAPPAAAPAAGGAQPAVPETDSSPVAAPAPSQGSPSPGDGSRADAPEAGTSKEEAARLDAAARPPATPDQLPVWLAVLASVLVIGSGTATVLAVGPRR